MIVPDECDSREGQLQREIVALMQKGGYWDAIMQGGSELDRVKEFLLMLSGEKEAIVNEMQKPNVLPVFPGLNYQAMHDNNYPWVDLLKDAYPEIKAEINALPKDLSFLGYEGGLADKDMWSVLPLHYMGTPIHDFQQFVPKTVELLKKLPNNCFDYPWGDALFSRQAGGSHLVAHCSIDAFRLRCHLGIDVPEGCEIRVKDQYTQWKNGEVFIFEDSFEHEVWNRSNQPRTVLILDFWHPDLTEIEKEALLAGFRKVEMRSMMCVFRLGDHREQFEGKLIAAFKEEDKLLNLEKYWPTADQL